LENPPNAYANLEPHGTENGLMAHSQARAALRVNEFCRLVGVSRTSFYKAVNSGAIRVIKIAGRTLVPADEVSRLLSGKDESRK
jgi:excisionase family DNA binding protein